MGILTSFLKEKKTKSDGYQTAKTRLITQSSLFTVTDDQNNKNTQDDVEQNGIAVNLNAAVANFHQSNLQDVTEEEANIGDEPFCPPDYEHPQDLDFPEIPNGYDENEHTNEHSNENVENNNNTTESSNKTESNNEAENSENSNESESSNQTKNNSEPETDHKESGSTVENATTNENAATSENAKTEQPDSPIDDQNKTEKKEPKSNQFNPFTQQPKVGLEKPKVNKQNNSQIAFLSDNKVRDDAADVKIESLRAYKEKAIKQSKNETHNAHKSSFELFQRLKSWFRYDSLFIQPKKDKLFSYVNVALSILFGFGVYLGVQQFLQSHLLSVTLNLYIGGITGLFFLAYFGKSVLATGQLVVKKKGKTEWQEVKKLYSCEKDNWLLLICSLVLGVSSYLVLGAITLVLGGLLALYLVTKRHFLATFIGSLLMLSVCISPIQVVYWDSLDVKTERVVVGHILANKGVKNVEQIPDNLKTVVEGAYLLPKDDIKVNYRYDVYIKPTKSLIYSLKYTKCSQSVDATCGRIKQSTEQDLWNKLVYRTKSGNYLITNFEDYRLFVSAVLSPAVNEYMRNNITYFRLPLREKEYMHLLPRQLEGYFQEKGLKTLGTPNIKFVLTDIRLTGNL